MLHVLIVEDSPEDAMLITRQLTSNGYQLDWQRVETAEQMNQALAAQPWDLIIADHSLPTFSAAEALDMVTHQQRDIPFIIVSGVIGEAAAVEMMRAGAHDYIMKNQMARLVPAVERELIEAQVRADRRQAREDRARLEQQLFYMQKMEAIATLTSGLAHDVNSMVAVIRGCVDNAGACLTEDHPAHAALQTIDHAAAQVHDVTNSLLTFSQSDGMDLEKTDLRSVIQDAVRLLKHLLPASIDLQVDLPGRPVSSYADASQLQRVLVNLAVNAREAMPQGGKLTVQLRQRVVESAAQAPGTFPLEFPASIISVSDTGMGMAPDILEHIFEPFFSTKPRERSTGLGLSVVHGIIERHGGWIQVETAPNQGATFQLILPSCEARDFDQTDQPDRQAENENGNILLIGSDLFVNSLMATSLQDARFQVTQVEDIENMVATVQQARPPIRLTVLDTDADVHQMKARLALIRHHLPNTPIIVACGEVDPQLDQLLGDQDHLLHKPFPVPRLIEHITELLNDRTPMDSKVDA